MTSEKGKGKFELRITNYQLRIEEINGQLLITNYELKRFFASLRCAQKDPEEITFHYLMGQAGAGALLSHGAAFLVFNATYRAGFAGQLLKLQCSYGIIGLELYRSISGKVSKRVEMAFMKLNGESELNNRLRASNALS